jgi:hypothetical protein
MADLLRLAVYRGFHQFHSLLQHGASTSTSTSQGDSFASFIFQSSQKMREHLLETLDEIDQLAERISTTGVSMDTADAPPSDLDIEGQLSLLEQQYEAVDQVQTLWELAEILLLDQSLTKEFRLLQWIEVQFPLNNAFAAMLQFTIVLVVYSILSQFGNRNRNYL